MASVMSDVLGFLERLGLFDVLLPFMLIYVMVFALLERTRVFGFDVINTDKGEVKISKQNLNAMFSFAIAFFAILSSQVVQTLHRAIGPVMILLLLIVLFLMLVSVFNKEGMFDFTDKKNKGWMIGFIIVILITIILIFMGSIQNDAGLSWLTVFWGFVSSQVNTGFIGAIVLLLIMVGIIGFVGGSPKHAVSEDDD
jgi:hypothetical protein